MWRSDFQATAAAWGCIWVSVGCSFFLMWMWFARFHASHKITHDSYMLKQIAFLPSINLWLDCSLHCLSLNKKNYVNSCPIDVQKACLNVAETHENIFRGQFSAGAVCAEMEMIYLKFCAFWVRTSNYFITGEMPVPSSKVQIWDLWWQ